MTRPSKKTASSGKKMGKTAKSSPKAPPKSRLTLGPLFFNWKAEKRRDFYFKIADEAEIDVVYLGEVVCSKREPFFEDMLPVVAERLRAAGKEVVLSTLALVTSEREMKTIAEHREQGFVVEANDVACLQALQGKPHVIGPFINVFNPSTLDFVTRNHAKRIVLSVELPAESIRTLAHKSKAETEVMVFGRLPLSVAMRCYHARAYGCNKDGCRIACNKDPDGLVVNTLDNEPFLTVSGSQTLSYGYGVMLQELPALQEMGVELFRLSPQDVDMVKVAAIYRSVLDQKVAPKAALTKLKKIIGAIPTINGFYHKREGMTWVSDQASGRKA